MTEPITIRGGRIPVPMYLHLLPVAEANGVDVFDVLVELARRQLAPPAAKPRTHAMAYEDRRKRNPRAHRIWTEETTEELRRLFAARRSDQSIALELGFTVRTIERRRASAGLRRTDERGAAA